MVFSSHLFIFYFLPVSLAVYFGLFRASQRARNLSLAVLGYVFYGWANPWFVFLMGERWPRYSNRSPLWRVRLDVSTNAAYSEPKMGMTSSHF
jgi:hypothetical protein